ncbi:hypothetical protein BN1723_003564 [Verticillium longisporum]|uniref:Cytochrome b5 heme-binding domain-containing protein n=2 Tax=Verticillium longisporum TaxID=100787 RepID=A0A0G4M2K2_VERLO|nr:hypothetical protein BN1723_003564 [Verticillium longisporum]
MRVFAGIVTNELPAATEWQDKIRCLQKAIDAVGPPSGEVTDIAVAAIHPFFRGPDWILLEEPKRFATELNDMRGLLTKSATNEKSIDKMNATANGLNDTDLYRQHHKATTPYETMMYKLWYPKARGGIRDWDVYDPVPLLAVLEAWNSLLPAFVRAQFLQDVVRKLETAVSEWNPRKKRQSYKLPHLWLFPWLQYLPSYHLDPKGTGLVADVRRKFRQLVDVWEFDRGVVPGLTQWRDVLGSQWQPLIMSHVLPSMGRYLRENFRVDPGDQEPYLPMLMGTLRSGVSSGFLNPTVGSAGDFITAEDDILVGVSRPVAFQLPLDEAAPCAFFAGGSGIAPFRSFWQSRAGRAVGRNILYLGVQNREKFCYEDELRRYVHAGFMEVHLAFSRDSRGLAYDSVSRDLIERRMEPRYIDALIAEQGATVCDLAMSKKQGGLGGHFRIWIGVHGSAYDVTDFCPMHPGGTLILKSNAGVDCSKSFDNLAHTNNPEVASLLTKYFVGHLTPRPEFHDGGELGGLYDLWADYLKTTVETLVAQQFEMEDLMGSSLWFQENMINIMGVRIFYQYQSRLLQSGFSALFGPKFQELVLKLSFAMANAASSAGSDTKLPDILGVVARAKTSADAVATSKEVALVGQYVCNSEPARFQERGIMDYASRSVSLDMALLEDIREEACHGMDAFGTVMELEATSDAQRVAAMCSFLMKVLERMAKRLEVFYAQLAQCSIYRPELERNPARTRWELVRRRIRDGSLFVLARRAVMEVQPTYRPARGDAVDFDTVLSRVQQTVRSAALPPSPPPETQLHVSMPLNERRRARAQVPHGAPSAVERYENGSAMRRMSSFLDKNAKALRRLSGMPALPQVLDLEQIMKAGQDHMGSRGGMPTPPSSRGSSRSPTRGVAEDLMSRMKLNRRGTSRSDSSLSMQRLPPAMEEPLEPVDAGAAIRSMVGKMNLRTRSTVGVPSSQGPGVLSAEERTRARSRSSGHSAAGSISRPRGSTSTLRSFRLRELVEGENYSRACT